MLNLALQDYGDLEYNFQCYSLSLLLFTVQQEILMKEKFDELVTFIKFEFVKRQ